MFCWMLSIHSSRHASLHKGSLIRKNHATIVILIFSMALEIFHKLYKIPGEGVLKAKVMGFFQNPKL